jgi:enamine deaminase RidA (YjgF/YER057c/UK114 family)
MTGPLYPWLRELPKPPPPAGAYRAVVVRNGIGCVSGQFPFVDGKLLCTGRIGAELSEEQGRRAADVTALNVLAQISTALGDFGRFGGLLRVDGFVASAKDFLAQPRILDAASERFVDLLGAELGAHARSVLKVDRLPLDAPVKLVVSFAVNGG